VRTCPVRTRVPVPICTVPSSFRGLYSYLPGPRRSVPTFQHASTAVFLHCFKRYTSFPNFLLPRTRHCVSNDSKSYNSVRGFLRVQSIESASGTTVSTGPTILIRHNPVLILTPLFAIAVFTRSPRTC